MSTYVGRNGDRCRPGDTSGETIHFLCMYAHSVLPLACLPLSLACPALCLGCLSRYLIVTGYV
jgi:hypothetical protein